MPARSDRRSPSDARSELRSSALARVLDDLVGERVDEAIAHSLTAADTDDPAWHLGLAAFASFIATRFDAGSDLADRALALAGDEETQVLATAAKVLAGTGRLGPDHGDLLDDLDAELAALDDSARGAFLHYLAQEAALTGARVQRAMEILAARGARERIVFGGVTHPFSVVVGVCTARTLAFAGRITDALAVLDELQRAALAHGSEQLEHLIDAATAFVEGNAADRARVRSLAARVEAASTGIDTYVATGVHLLVAFGLTAVGDLTESARFALAAVGGDPEAAKLTVVNRALLYELLIAQAAATGDMDAADAWMARAEALDGSPAAASTLARIRARHELLAGDPALAAEWAEQAIVKAKAEGRGIEAAEGEVLAARAQVALSHPGDARRRLEHLVADADSDGYGAPREAAQRLLRSSGRRLRPTAGSEWAGLSPRERDVALLVAEGAANPEIAEQLHISLHTVRAHVSRVLAAFGAASRYAIVSKLTSLQDVPADAPPLTPRQREVADLVADGLGNGEIAAALGVSVKTVEKHVGDILRTWNVSTRLGIARIALAERPAAE